MSATPVTHLQIECANDVRVLKLCSDDGMNRLARQFVGGMIKTLHDLACDPHPLIITGNERFFSAGADLGEIAALTGPQAYEFSKLGQALMNFVERFPAPVYAAIAGYCMGGGLDLALACHRRIASRNAVLGHRGAALGLVTGWGGTQRLPRLVGKARALQMLMAAEKIHGQGALQIGLVNAIADDPVGEAARRIALYGQSHEVTE